MCKLLLVIWISEMMLILFIGDSGVLMFPIVTVLGLCLPLDSLAVVLNSQATLTLSQYTFTIVTYFIGLIHSLSLITVFVLRSVFDAMMSRSTYFSFLLTWNTFPILSFSFWYIFVRYVFL